MGSACHTDYDSDPRFGTFIIDRSDMGRIWMRGGDSLDLLNRLSTNEVDSVAAGKGASTVLTTNKGRMIDQLVVLHVDESVILLTSPGTTKSVSNWIDRYTIVEDVELEDLGRSTSILGVMGQRASLVVERALSVPVSQFALFDSLLTEAFGSWLLITRTDSFGVREFDLMAPNATTERVFALVMDAGSSFGTQPIPKDRLETLRLEKFVPRWGRELTPDYNPLEAGLLDSISWTKGCYIGQEVVARLWTYRKIQKYRVGFSFATTKCLKLETPVLVEGKKVGYLTSAAPSAISGNQLGMGYLKPTYAQEGRLIECFSEDGELVGGVISRTVPLPPDKSPASALALSDNPL